MTQTTPESAVRNTRLLQAPGPYSVVDLFSGAGGMSFGFHAHPDFAIVGAADAQMGKPSSPAGSLGCNETYIENIGIRPVEADLGRVDPDELLNAMNVRGPVDVLSACSPCTGFSRTSARNHLTDDPRNSLVDRVAVYAAAIRPRVIVMENARELVRGRWAHHLSSLELKLGRLGYQVHAGVHLLNAYGLPQVRERALVIGVADGYRPRTLEEAWEGLSLAGGATTVRRAISNLPPLEAGYEAPSDPDHTSPKMTPATLDRLRLIPRDGGSWRDLLCIPGGQNHMTPAMKRFASNGVFGSFPDVYGRMAWGRPAPTIKRECGHVGNGRYSHPDQDRLCSVRELAVLNGFPRNFRFKGSMGNKYRHIGDAVPPLVSYQIASVCRWILSDIRPEARDLILPGTHLMESDIREARPF